MKDIVIRTASCILSGFTIFGHVHADETSLEFVRFDLRDGRTLHNVVVKSYDPASATLLVMADGKAITVPIALVYPPFNEELKQAPQSGTTTTVVPGPTPTPPSSTVRAPRSTTAQPSITRSTTTARTASRATTPARSTASQTSATEVSRGKAHRAVALDRARKYFNYEHLTGSANIVMLQVEVEAPIAKPVTGWPGRYRTHGKAYLVIFDTRGRSTRRTTSTFEVLTEQKSGQEIETISFTRKR